jgi:hypothetical protein
VVFHEDQESWLGDGHHTLAAYRLAGRKTIPARLTSGTKDDAILYAAGANATHGLRRTQDDKRKAVLTLLGHPVWGKWNKGRAGGVTAPGDLEADLEFLMRACEKVEQIRKDLGKVGSNRFPVRFMGILPRLGQHFQHAGAILLDAGVADAGDLFQGCLRRGPRLHHLGQLLVGEDRVHRYALGLGDFLPHVPQPGEDREIFGAQGFPVVDLALAAGAAAAAVTASLRRGAFQVIDAEAPEGRR